MNVTTRLAAFGVGLVAVLAVGLTAGASVGPTPSAAAPKTPMGGMAAAMPAAPHGAGVVATADGYRVTPATTHLQANGGMFRFTITAPDGRPATRFVANHERLLHLIVVNRELTVFQHVHPVLAGDGTWSVALPALPAGSYRAVADFRVTDGPALVLGTDLSVAGLYQPATPPEPSTHATIDGYEVTLAAQPGSAGEVTIALTVRKGGELVTDLQPYLGAAGHLVAMRAGDLAYSHVHPLSYTAGTVRFEAELAATGRYRLFFDFQHNGTVRTAAFTFDHSQLAGAPASDRDGASHD